MKNLSAPIYIGALNDKPLRFFRAPFQEPHLPWHSWDDLLNCLCASISSKADYNARKTDALRFLRQEYPNDIMSVSHQSEIISVTPHYIAKCCIIHLSPSLEFRAVRFKEYKQALSNAWCSFTEVEPRPESENLLVQAIRNTDQAEAMGYAV